MSPVIQIIKIPLMSNFKKQKTMKKIIFCLLACVAMFSCNSFESKVTKVDDTFESFTTLNTEGDTLTGLRKIGESYNIVDPGAFKDFKVVDGKMITCSVNASKALKVFSLMGIELTENLVDSIAKDDTRFICYYNGGKVIFFPKDDEWIDCKASFATKEYLFCRLQDDTWKVYVKATNDKIISKNRDITIIKDISNKEKAENIIIAYEFNGNYKVIDMNDEDVATLKPKDFKRFEKKFKNQKTLDGNSRYVEVKGFVI